MTEPVESDVSDNCPGCARPHVPDARFCMSCGLKLMEDPALGEGAQGSVADPLVGRTIADRYKILSLVGRGGMGVVYKCEHVHIGKLMAIKLLHGELARDRETIKRFQREAEAASRLSHANTVQVFDFGRDQGLMYLVMEFLEGHDLGVIIQREGNLDFARVARLCGQVCSSVAEAHAEGVVHRDLKPENIMVFPGREGSELVKVLDFGLAKLRQEGSSRSLTRAGSIIGTPYYMAPEHIRGDEVDPRADIYSLGAVIYKALTGVPPFYASSAVGVLTKHLTDDVVPPSERSSNRDVPPEADAVVLRAMEKNAEDRYQSMEDLRHDLYSYLISQGEEIAGVSGMSLSSVRASVVLPAKVRVATRGDVDHYERGLRRRGWLGKTVALALVAVGAIAAWTAVDHYGPSLASSFEDEPNNEPSEANPLEVGIARTGHIGKRLSLSRSDHDIYDFWHGPGRRHVRLSVSAIQNMDLALDIVKAGDAAPVLTVDGAGVGEPEILPNFPLSSPRYYFRVREAAEPGRVPSENVSDTYEIVVRYVDPGPGDENEINDSLELANPIAVGVEVRGFIGWSGDVDTYCLTGDAASVTARVRGVPNLDLVLRVVDRVAGSSRKIDAHGAGEAEASERITPARARVTCVELSADSAEGVASNPTETYTLTLTPGEAGEASP